MPVRPTILILALVALLLSAPAAMPSADPGAAVELSWSNASSPGGGPVQGIGGSSEVLVASTWSTGTYRSFDNGLHWEPIPDFPPVSEATRIVFDPNDPLVGYVAGFGGVARTLDGGLTWSLVLPTYVSYRLAVSPTGAVVASMRDDEQVQRVYRSFDRGETWEDLDVPPVRWTSMYGLAFGSDDDNIVAKSFGTMWVTHDGGATWTTTNQDGFDLARDADGSLWLGGFTLRRSTDGGATWHAVEGAPAGWPIAARPGGGLFVRGGDGLHVTTDGGATWTSMGYGDETFGATTLFPDPADPEAVFVSDEFLGVVRVGPHPDGGFALEGRTTGLTPVPVHGLASSADGSVLLAASPLGLYTSRDRGDTWAHTGAGMGLIGLGSAAASADGSVLVGGGQNRVFQPFVVVSRDGGRTFDQMPLHVGGDGYIGGLAFAGDSNTRIYAAATMQLAYSRILESTDGGRTWTAVFSIPQKIRDVAWDDVGGKLLVATEVGVFAYEGAGVVSPRGATFNTWTVAAEAGRAYSVGPEVTLWRSAPATGLLAPWANTGTYLVDIAPEPGAGMPVWAVDKFGATFRCVDSVPRAACADVGPAGVAQAALVTRDGGRVIVGTSDAGLFMADL